METVENLEPVVQNTTPFFVDATGMRWVVSLSVGLLEDIQEQTTIDLDAMMKKPTALAELVMASPKSFVSMMWVICESQCKEHNIDARDFGRRFGRDTLDAASDAFILAILLFFPRQSGGRVVAESFPRIMQKMDKEIRENTQKAINKVLSS